MGAAPRDQSYQEQPMGRTAFITGVTGQDGSYLAELLLERGYDVHGQTTRAPTASLGHAESLRSRLNFHHLELCDRSAATQALAVAAPTELYLLASQSRVPPSWADPATTLRQNVE